MGRGPYCPAHPAARSRPVVLGGNRRLCIELIDAEFAKLQEIAKKASEEQVNLFLFFLNINRLLWRCPTTAKTPRPRRRIYWRS